MVWVNLYSNQTLIMIMRAAAKGAKRVASTPKRQPMPKAQPYFDRFTNKTKYSTDVRIGELPRKAKRK